MQVAARSVNWEVCGPAPGPARKVGELGGLRPGAPDHLAAARRLPLGLTGNRAFHWKDRAPKDHPAGAPRDSARRGRRGRRRHGRGCNPGELGGLQPRGIGTFAARPRDRPARSGNWDVCGPEPPTISRLLGGCRWGSPETERSIGKIGRRRTTLQARLAIRPGGDGAGAAAMGVAATPGNWEVCGPAPGQLVQKVLFRIPQLVLFHHPTPRKTGPGHLGFETRDFPK